MSTSLTSKQLESLLKEASIAEIIEFREFLHDVYSNENLTFWLEVENFKSEETEDVVGTAKKIFEKYCSSTTASSYELNISNAIKTRLAEKMKNPDKHVFDEVQEAILTLMAEDSYPKFLQSDRFKKFKERKVDPRRPRATQSVSIFNDYLQTRTKKKG